MPHARYDIDPAPGRITGFTLTVDAARSYSDMVAAGNYAEVHPLITQEHFPVDKAGYDTEAALLYFGRWISVTKVLYCLEEQRLRPAVMGELLAFGAQYPDSLSEEPIVALDARWNAPWDDDICALVYPGANGRSLSVSRTDHGLDNTFQFLVTPR